MIGWHARIDRSMAERVMGITRGAELCMRRRELGSVVCGSGKVGQLDVRNNVSSLVITGYVERCVIEHYSL